MCGKGQKDHMGTDVCLKQNNDFHHLAPFIYNGNLHYKVKKVVFVTLIERSTSSAAAMITMDCTRPYHKKTIVIKRPHFVALRDHLE